MQLKQLISRIKYATADFDIDYQSNYNFVLRQKFEIKLIQN